MKVAVVGSRGLRAPDLTRFLPDDTDEIISGGAVGVDTDAALYARTHGLPLTVIRPDYPRYGRRAPIMRNLQIIDAADFVLAFWDGRSRGTAFVIRRCRERGVPLRVLRRTAPVTDAPIQLDFWHDAFSKGKK